jgi:hypothetical protein
MSGYDWSKGKSNNAISAENDGKLPATQFAKWARKWFPGVVAQDVRIALVATEWHHSSKFFNRVDYYDKRDLLENDNRTKLRETIARRKEINRLYQFAQKIGLVDPKYGFKVYAKFDGVIGLWHCATKTLCCEKTTYYERVKQTLEQGFAA